MKRFLAVLIFLSMTLLVLAGCDWHNSAASDEQLKSVLVKSTNQQIVYFKSIDIGNNEKAAFAILSNGNVWYVTSSGAQFLHGQTVSAALEIKPQILTIDNTKIFKCEVSGGGSGGSNSCAWYIRNGKPVSFPYVETKYISDLIYTGNGQFTANAFIPGDAIFKNGLGWGRTQQKYYFYWATDGFKEYGGLKITLQQLLEFKGTQNIINVILNSGKTIDDIYYRVNNIININYHDGDKNNGNFDNITLSLKNNVVTPILIKGTSATESLTSKNLSDFSYGGIYEVALYPKIATYPDKSPIN
jgi:hypothetical protein